MAGNVWVIKGGSFLCGDTYCLRYRPAARRPQMVDTGKVGAVGARGVGRDDRVVPDDGGIEVDVVGESDLDDANDAVGRMQPDRAGRVRLVEATA